MFAVLLPSIILAKQGMSFVSLGIVLSIFGTPFIVVCMYLIFRTTLGMPIKSFRQWVMFYPFFVGFGLFWMLLAYIFDVSLPFLLSDYRETTLPLLVILCITLVLTLTRLKYRVARFLNKVFGTEPMEETYP
jgi:uncharacterized membrane protein